MSWKKGSGSNGFFWGIWTYKAFWKKYLLISALKNDRAFSRQREQAQTFQSQMKEAQRTESMPWYTL